MHALLHNMLHGNIKMHNIVMQNISMDNINMHDIEMHNTYFQLCTLVAIFNVQRAIETRLLGAEKIAHYAMCITQCSFHQSCNMHCAL